MFFKLLLNVFILLIGVNHVLGASAHYMPDSLKSTVVQTDSSKSTDKKSIPDSLKFSLNQAKDTLNGKNDSLKKKNKNAIDDPVKYTAKDSVRFNMNEKKVYLYGNGYIKYKDIELKAAYIELNLNNDQVFAKGVLDSAGKEIGKPVFKQKEQQFDAVEMTYNFKSKKGLIKGVITKQEGSFLHSELTKKQADDVICLQHGKFTTCDLPHPHFYIALSKAKMIPDDKIVSGPAYLVIEDIPLPIGIPFGFFPNKKGSTSGILIPEYGEEQSNTGRGFFLRNGGYYFAINDYFDLALTGDIYSNLSWGASMFSKYNRRYKFSGNFAVKLNENYIGEEGDPNYGHNKLYSVSWSHNQDPKARPNSTFGANVNISSSSYDRYNAMTTYTGNMFTNQKQSNISYTQLFPGTPISFSANLRHSQNSTDSTITLAIPDLNFNVSRLFPFRKKNKTGNLTWYDNLGISYTSSLQNKISIKESKLFTPEAAKKFQNGILHSIPISTSIKAFKYFSLSPSVNFTERWYFNHVNKNWDSNYLNKDGTTGAVVTDTINNFDRVYDYNTSLSLTTTMYGMYQFKKFPIKAIRHVITPSVSLSYHPDFGDDKYGYYKYYMNVKRKTDGTPYDTVKTRYSIFENGIFGTPGYGKSGMINFSLNNNLEMKVKSKADTIDGTKKVKIFDNLGFSSSYNLAADSMNWSPISISGNTNILRLIDLRFSTTLDPYAYDSIKGVGFTRINKYQMDKSTDIGRLTNASVSIGASFHSANPNQNTQGNKNDPNTSPKNNRYTEDGYSIFKIPWNISINYNLRYDKQFIKGTTNQTLQISGDFYLTPKWRCQIRTDYDFIAKKLVNANVDITRDLHCWEMSFHWIPFGVYQSYVFRINVKSTLLKDLKYERKKDWLENLGAEQQ